MKKVHDAVAEDATQNLDARQIGSRWIWALALAIVVAVVLALTVSRGFADQIARDIFFSLTLAGCTIVFLSVRPWREFPQAVGAGAVLAGLQMVVLKTPFRVLSVFAYLGLGSLLLLAIRRIWSRSEDRQLLQDATLPPLLFLILGYFGSGPLAMTARLHPTTLDTFLYSFEQSLGVQLSFKLGQVMLSSRLLTRVVLGAYYVLPLVIMFTYARQLVRNRNLAMIAFLAFVIAGPLGVVFYNPIPAGGPGNLFGSKLPLRSYVDRASATVAAPSSEDWGGPQCIPLVTPGPGAARLVVCGRILPVDQDCFRRLSRRHGHFNHGHGRALLC